jgi:4,5-DOPA dioxygenase extradiol
MADMPVVFVSHGSPMVAIETGPYQDALARFGRAHRPSAIVVISAHWDSGAAVRITSAARHRLIYDFGGFPQDLYELQYDAPGDPQLAGRIDALLREAGMAPTLDASRGIDHGVWIPLRLMYPDGGIPVVEVSFPGAMQPEQLFQVGKALAPLGSEGVLILASGGIVHNLRRLDWQHRNRPNEAWAETFDNWFARRLAEHDYEGLFGYQDRAPHAAWAVPTNEHFHPVFVALGAAGETAAAELIYEGFEYGTLSLRSFALR